MNETFMLLPGKTLIESQVVRLPHDCDEHEAYRCVTEAIAGLRASDPDHTATDVLEALAERGFSPVELVVGPRLG